MSLELPWWASLKHGGLFLSAARLAELLYGPAPSPRPHVVARLRGDLQRLADSPEDAAATKALLDTVLHDVAGMRDSPTTNWQRGNDVEPRFSRRAASGEMVKPRRVWTGPNGAVLPLFVDEEPRLGQGRGRRSVSRVIEWCRGTGTPLALLTNARQFRLLHVAAEHDAWCEWDTALWFEAGQPSAQIEALQRLLAPEVHTPARSDGVSPLLDAIRRSRQGQSQLSSLLGERVRQAVEVLIHAHTPHLSRHTDFEKPEIYRAATLVVMRLVVALFAEARDLFPRSNRVYEGSYGVQGLWEKLSRAAGGNTSRMRQRYSAWPQVLALFRLIHDGSTHGELTVRAYGGELFRPGTPDDSDGVRRAMHLFETACYVGDPAVMNDAEVFHILELLTRCAMPVRQGRNVTTVTVPVDFADLSTEYIGILYEGLLDYELHQVPVDSDDPILFINLGDQPALPLSRLESLSGSTLKTFFKEFQKKGGAATASDEAADEEGGDSGDDSPEDTDPAAEVVDAELLTVADSADNGSDSARQRALAWARRAVVEAQLVKAYTGGDPVRRADAEEKIARAANQLVIRTILPGDFFLVRWGGTRKGQGSFYTRPGLVAPTVQRTLAPLCYELPGEPTLEELRDPKKPRPPAVIFGLKVCDPATGSASFPVSALRYLSEALWRSLLHYEWLVVDEAAGSYRPGNGLPAGEPPWFRECVRDLPTDLAAAEGTIRARLKRLIVERCLYGVDLDPLAIELARLSLWVETMNRELPFGFLDHKFKCGNGLIGCWFDRFQEYPALCLHRPGDDAGDKAHNTGVHLPKGGRSEALKTFREETLKPSLVHWLQSHDPLVMPFLRDGQKVEDLHAAATHLMEQLHALPVHETEERARYYREKVEPAIVPLRAAFDLWCSLWFWPVEQLDNLPLPHEVDRPSAGGSYTSPSEAAQRIARSLRERYRFFHWELEFPDVFIAPDAGFDAILGNPPWEIQKPNSKEFFSNHDPLYRTYGKQEALRRQKELFTLDIRIEQEWLGYCGRFKELSNWCANAAYPWADPADGAAGGGKWSIARGAAAGTLHRDWRARRALRKGYCDRAHPFRHQGSADLNTYKLFLEQMHALLRFGGRLGVVVPSNIYTDKGSTTLRKLFITRCRWEWVFSFENREKIFDIHRSFKFCPIVLQKGGETAAIRTAFMRRNLDDWRQAELFSLSYRADQVRQFSPNTYTLLEVRRSNDLTLIQGMYERGTTMGLLGLDYGREFHMTEDSALFPPRPDWEEKGYVADEYGHWLKGNWQPAQVQTLSQRGLNTGDKLVFSRDRTRAVTVTEINDVALPLYEGRMIDHFDFSAAGWISGKGRSAKWRDIPSAAKRLEPQFLIGIGDARRKRSALNRKLGQMRVTSATNARTLIVAFVDSMPCGDKVVTMRDTDLPRLFSMAAVLNTLAFDWQARLRVGGLQLDEHVLMAMPLVVPQTQGVAAALSNAAIALCCNSWLHSVTWLEWHKQTGRTPNLYRLPISDHERLRLKCMIDALTAHTLGFSQEDFTEILRDCDHPKRDVLSDAFTRTLDPKGFWRVDKATDPELRYTVLAQVAFQDLMRAGPDAFLAANQGQGWMLPETLRLSDYSLGHDDRAREPQPVAGRLGAKFYPWQLEGTVEESWEECHRHADLIRAIRSIGSPSTEQSGGSATAAATPQTDLLGQPIETDLFGQEAPAPRKRRR